MTAESGRSDQGLYDLGGTTPVSATCTDSDGGLNYYVKGVLSVGDNTYSDVCADSNFVKEYFCDNPPSYYDNYYCPNGCLNGACVNNGTSNLCSIAEQDELGVDICSGYTCREGNGSISVQIANGPLNENLSGILLVFTNSTNTLQSFTIYQNIPANNEARTFNFNDASLISADRVSFSPIVGNNQTCGSSQTAMIPYCNVEMEPVPSCQENYKIRLVNFQGDNNEPKVDVEILNGGYWMTTCSAREVGESCFLGNVELAIKSISVGARVADLEVLSPAVFDYRLVSVSGGQDYWASINSKEMQYNDQTDKMVIVSYCGGGNEVCTLTPTTCPPHGTQTQTCTSSDGSISSTSTISCTPGECSGCYVPRWFGYSEDNTCIPYGMRFNNQVGWTFGELAFNREETDSLSVSEVEDYDDVSLEVYSNSTALLGVQDFDGEYVYLSLVVGQDYDWDELFNLEYYTNYSAVLHVDNIVYSGENYSNSYIEITFSESGSYQSQTPDSFSAYCNIDGTIYSQKIDGDSCQNNFECASNECRNGACVNSYALAQENAGTLSKIWCYLTSGIPLFGGSEEEYTQCLGTD